MEKLLQLTYFDSKTGLMWAKNANLAGKMTWHEAMNWVGKLNYGDYSDWRLPTIEELEEITAKAMDIDSIQCLNAKGFHNVKANWYWSNTEDDTLVDNEIVGAWMRDMRGCSGNSHKNDDGYVWPVRCGQDSFSDNEVSANPCNTSPEMNSETALLSEKELDKLVTKANTALRKILYERWNSVLKLQPESDPLKDLKIAIKNIPNSGSFRSGAVAVRKLIRESSGKIKLNEMVAILYDLAAIDSFLSVSYAEDISLPNDRDIKYIQPEQWRNILKYDYKTLGYEQLPLLSKTDCAWCKEVWGSPNTHTTLGSMHKSEWHEASQRLLKCEWYEFFDLEPGDPPPEPCDSSFSFEEFLVMKRKSWKKVMGDDLSILFSLDYQAFIDIQRKSGGEQERGIIANQMSMDEQLTESYETPKKLSRQERQGEHPLVKQLPNVDILYISDDDPENIYSAKQSISVKISEHEFEVEIDTFDQSTIFTKLPVTKTIKVVEDPDYYPSYARFTPHQRWKYLDWLLDVSAPINIGYVFVYFYGLERQLLFDNFEKAFSEIMRLKLHHHCKPFDDYSNSALFHACLYRKRFDKLKELCEITPYISDSLLLASCQLNLELSQQQVIQIFEEMPGLDRKYLRENKDSIISVLAATLMKQFISEGFPLYRLVDVENIQKRRRNIFANSSLPIAIRSPLLPDFFHNREVVSIVKELYKNACKESKGSKKG